MEKTNDSQTHLLKGGFICDTEARGHKTPQGRSITEIVVDASEGFIPLWEKNTTLRWRIRERSLSGLPDADARKAEIRAMFAEALLAWGSAAPVRFTEDDDVWDFEIVMKRSDECQQGGCVLAEAFFPDQGRHQFLVYPLMFKQSHKEQIDTLLHELGHVFGLRHFFANISETDFPSQIFGEHNKFSIMNYGNLSELTDADKRDLTLLYEQAWSGKLVAINGTPIKFVRPFHTLNETFKDIIPVEQLQAALLRQLTSNMR